MRNAFTMIELIFVIVLIGILSSIAIPRLSTTRDDAEAVKAAEEVRTLISDLAVYYTASGKFDRLGKMSNVTLVDAGFHPFDGNLTTKAYYANSAKTEKCLGIQVSSTGGDLNISAEGSTSTLCQQLTKILKRSIKVHHFGGAMVSLQ